MIDFSERSEKLKELMRLARESRCKTLKATMPRADLLFICGMDEGNEFAKYLKAFDATDPRQLDMKMYGLPIRIIIGITGIHCIPRDDLYFVLKSTTPAVRSPRMETEVVESVS